MPSLNAREGKIIYVVFRVSRICENLIFGVHKKHVKILFQSLCARGKDFFGVTTRTGVIVK